MNDEDKRGNFSLHPLRTPAVQPHPRHMQSLPPHSHSTFTGTRACTHTHAHALIHYTRSLSDSHPHTRRPNYPSMLYFTHPSSASHTCDIPQHYFPTLRTLHIPLHIPSTHVSLLQTCHILAHLCFTSSFPPSPPNIQGKFSLHTPFHTLPPNSTHTTISPSTPIPHTLSTPTHTPHAIPTPPTHPSALPRRRPPPAGGTRASPPYRGSSVPS